MEITQNLVSDNMIGCFEVSEHSLLDPEIVAIMQSIVVIRCEYLYDLRVFEYVGYSNFFKPLPRKTYISAPRYYFARSKSTGDIVAIEAGKETGKVEWGAERNPEEEVEPGTKTETVAKTIPIKKAKKKNATKTTQNIPKQ